MVMDYRPFPAPKPVRSPIKDYFYLGAVEYAAKGLADMLANDVLAESVLTAWPTADGRVFVGKQKGYDPTLTILGVERDPFFYFGYPCSIRLADLHGNCTKMKVIELFQKALTRDFSLIDFSLS